MICFNFIPWFRQWFRVLYRQTEAPELKRVMKSLKQRFYGNNDSFEYKEIIPKEIKLTDLNVGLSITLDHRGLLKLSFIFTAKVYPRIPLCPSSGSFVPRFLPIRHPGLQYQGRHWRKASQARCSLSFSEKITLLFQEPWFYSKNGTEKEEGYEALVLVSFLSERA